MLCKKISILYCKTFPAVLLCLALFFPVIHLYAQDSELPGVLFRSFPENPIAGKEWTLVLSVDHPDPDEVTVLAPAFTDSFFLDRTYKNARNAEEAETASRWTEVEYRFLLESPGSFILEPFTVITPAGRVQTESRQVNVRSADISINLRPTVLTWSGNPFVMRVGEEAYFGLKLSGWDAKLPLPPPGIFMPPLPEGAVVEAIVGKAAGTVAEAAAGIAANTGRNGDEGFVFQLKLIPIKAVPVIIPERVFTYNNTAFTIPRLSITVLSPLPQSLPAAAADASGGAENNDAGQNSRLFPEYDTALSSGGFFSLYFHISSVLFKSGYENTYRTAENLWNRRYYAESLALLRGSERDHVLGPLFSPIRRGAENNLGLDLTGNENPRILITGLLIFCLVFVTAIVFIYVMRNKGRKKLLPLFAVLFLIILLPLIFYGTPVNKYFSFGSSRYGVLKEAGVRRVPDPSGEFVSYFREGQPVKITEEVIHQQVSWVWVLSNDKNGLAGWIPEDRVVYY